MNQTNFSDLTTKLRLDASFPEQGVTEHKGNRWRVEEVIGTGTFGIVRREKCEKQRRWYELGDESDDDEVQQRAVKQIVKIKLREIARELEALAIFSQPQYRKHFVQMLGWYEGTESVYIAMEYLELGNLHQRFLHTSIPEMEVKLIMHQLFDAVSHLHEKGIVHRDLKLKNILVVQEGPFWHVKIADFGLSKNTQVSELSTLAKGTESYMAPELRKSDLNFDDDGNHYFEIIEPTISVDLWSLGVIMFMLLTRERPFPDGRSLVRYVKAQMRTPNDIWATEWASKLVPAEAHDLVRQLLVLEPFHRITARDASQHLWYGPFALQNYQALESEAKFKYYEELSGFAREHLVREREGAEVAEQERLIEKEWRKEEYFCRMGV
ncbi:hypothetical protein MMC17_010175 [Xylographa soralifera]|nr:hypothetical protein [Xylographa soralifera]